jgi:hypothetical protein
MKNNSIHVFYCIKFDDLMRYKFIDKRWHEECFSLTTNKKEKLYWSKIPPEDCDIYIGEFD